VRKTAVLLAVQLLLLATSARAQLITAGAGPAYPKGDFKSELGVGNALFLSGRVNLSLLVFSLQLELAHTDWDWEESGAPNSLEVWQPGVNLAFHFIRVGPVRPYVLAGVLGSNQKLVTPTSDDSGVHFGYQAGAGVDFKLGPLKPFVEFRWVQLDGPGGLTVKYSPLLFGVGIF